MAISPQLAEHNAEVKSNNQIEFPILSDAGNAYAKQLSLAFALPDDLRAVYRDFGASLPEFNGDDSWELPLPARLVVDGEGIIRSIDADPDYRRRPEPSATIEVLSTLD